jgi:hypothetical protein
MLVINCGYPMYLAVSKRDFLNKLMYRFPPGPQYATDRTHEFILTMLGKWCVALCQRSQWGKEFGNIQLMHSLLKNRGFQFPTVDEEDVLAQERKVQEAKLEDLLRRGTPADLRVANELMKVMSGYVAQCNPLTGLVGWRI